MLHPHTQAIFDKHDRGERITDKEMLYLERVCRPFTKNDWLWIILPVVAFGSAMIWFIVR